MHIGWLRARARVSSDTSRFSAWWVAYAVFILCVVAALLPGAYIWRAVGEVDARAADREATLLRQGIEEAFRFVTREQQTGTIWVDAVVKARAGDTDWLSYNVGIWFHDFYGHDVVYIVDPSEAPIYAMVAGEDVAPAAFSEDAELLRPMLAATRAAMVDADPQEVALRDLMVVRGAPALVSVVPIVDDTGTIEVTADTAHLHVSVRMLDAAFFGELSERFLLSDIHLLPPGSPERAARSLPLLASNGAEVAQVAWSPHRPAAVAVQRSGPGVAVYAVALLAVVAVLLARLHRAVTELDARRAEAERLSRHDVLTGLPNRGYFALALGDALAAVETDGGRAAVHYIDLDGFKNINDTLGHPVGDELIRQVGARLQGMLRKGDMIARLGGDEFAVLQTGIASMDEAHALADRILSALEAPFDLDGHQGYVGASIGIATAPDAGRDETELMRKADIALYEAKAHGKGRHRSFVRDLEDDVARTRVVEWRLREALTSGEGLRLAYQPLFAPDGETVIGAEALLRCDDAGGAPCPPPLLIRVAEERGLMKQLGEWILRNACATAQDLDLPFVAVNVSATQLTDPDFADVLFAILRECDLSAERLQIEITEGLLLDATEQVTMTLTRLRFAGVQIALDDFGTGYSSLRYLQKFKVDKIKIDRSFVDRLGKDEEADAIVRVMIDLARTLRLDVTAEGVETAEQWAQLRNLGAPELQGFLFALPLSADLLARQLQRRPADTSPTTAA